MDELESIVRTAHGLGRKVTMHCTATAAVANALAARVDSIEVGYVGEQQKSEILRTQS